MTGILIILVIFALAVTGVFAYIAFDKIEDLKESEAERLRAEAARIEAETEQMEAMHEQERMDLRNVAVLLDSNNTLAAWMLLCLACFGLGYLASSLVNSVDRPSPFPKA